MFKKVVIFLIIAVILISGLPLSVIAEEGDLIVAVGEEITLNFETGIDKTEIKVFDDNQELELMQVNSEDMDDKKIWSLKLALYEEGDKTLEIYAEDSLGNSTHIMDQEVTVIDDRIIDDGDVEPEDIAATEEEVTPDLFNAWSVTNAMVNKPFSITVETSHSVEDIKIFNENESEINILEKKYEYQEGIKNWKLLINLSSVGLRELTIYGYDKAGDIITADEIEKSLEIIVAVERTEGDYSAVQHLPELYNAESDVRTAIINTNFNIVVTTTKRITSLKIYNENGTGIYQASRIYFDTGNIRTFIVTLNIGTVGNRTLSVFGVYDDTEIALKSLDVSIIAESTGSAETIPILFNAVGEAESVEKNQAFTVTSVTTDMVEGFEIANGANEEVLPEDYSFVIYEGLKIWSLEFQFSESGDQQLEINAVDGASNVLDKKIIVPVYVIYDGEEIVLQPEPESEPESSESSEEPEESTPDLISLELYEENILKDAPFNLNIVTTKSVEDIKITNEQNNEIRIHSREYSDEGGTRNWRIKISLSDLGERALAIHGYDKDGNTVKVDDTPASAEKTLQANVNIVDSFNGLNNVDVIPELINAELNVYQAEANKSFDIVVTSSVSVLNIILKNETENIITPISSFCYEKSGVKTFIITVMLETEGERLISIYGTDEEDEIIDDLIELSVEVGSSEEKDGKIFNALGYTDSVYIGQEFKVMAVTNDLIEDLEIYNGNEEIFPVDIEYIDQGNLKVWEVTFEFSESGNTELQISGLYDEDLTTSNVAIVSVYVIDPNAGEEAIVPDLLEVSKNNTYAYITQEFEINIKTSKSVEDIKITDDLGEEITIYSMDYYDVNQIRTWYLTLKSYKPGINNYIIHGYDYKGEEVKDGENPTEEKTLDISMRIITSRNELEEEPETAHIFKVDSNVKEVEVSTNLNIVITATKDIARIVSYNGSNAMLSLNSQYFDVGDKRIFILTIVLSSQGERNISVRGFDENNNLVSNEGVYCTVKALKKLPEKSIKSNEILAAAENTSLIEAGENFEMTLVTSDAVNTINFTDENNNTITADELAFTASAISSGVKIWTAAVGCNVPGQKAVNVWAEDINEEQSENSVKFNFFVIEVLPGEEEPEISQIFKVEANVKEVAVSVDFNLIVTTTKDIERVVVYNGSGTGMAIFNRQLLDVGDKRIFILTIVLPTQGERDIYVKGFDENDNSVLNEGEYCTVNVHKKLTGNSIKSNEILAAAENTNLVEAGENFELTLVTSDAVNTINFTDENDNTITSDELTFTASAISSGVKIWTAVFECNVPGQKAINALAEDINEVQSENSMNFIFFVDETESSESSESSEASESSESSEA